MAFFDDVKRLSKNVADKGKDAIEITKLNSQIGSEKDKMRDTYVKIGEAIFMNFKNGNDQGFGETCVSLQEAESRIDDLKNKIIEIKGATKCPSCGEEVGKETVFCPKCGGKVS